MKLARLWPFMPTFRVVAEIEHVTKAATTLRVSPSAVSRTIALLEAEIGYDVFDRAGRRISLNRAGAELLASVRAAMRVLDDGLTSAEDRRFAGPIRVAAVEPFVTCLSGATFRLLHARFPRLVPALARPPEHDIAKMLLSGAADVAFVRHPPTSPHLVTSRLCGFETGAFARADHPILRDRRAIARVPCVDVASARATPSPWPADLARQVCAIVADYDAALHMCVAAPFVAALPLSMVAAYDAGRGLRRVDGIPTSPVAVFAVTREIIVASGAAEVLVDCAREACAAEG